MYMDWNQRSLLLLLGLLVLGVTLELIRKRRLREEYAILWVCTGLMILLFVVAPKLLYLAAEWVHLDNATLLAFICFCFLASIVMHYSVVITRHSEREKNLSQELALLRDELDKLRAESRQAPLAPVEPKPKPPALRT